MTSIRIKLSSETDVSNKRRIIYKITHGGRSKSINSSVSVFAWDWDNKTSSINMSGSSSDRYSELKQASDKVQNDIRSIYQIISRLMLKSPSFTVDDIVQLFVNKSQCPSLFSFMQQRIESLQKQGKMGTAATYSTTLSSFKRFRQFQDVHFNSIDSSLIKDYEIYLQEKGLSKNTTSFYMRVLRSVYNQAITQGLIEPSQPFANVYTGIAKTKKRAICDKDIRKIIVANLTDQSQLDFARDMFLFSFYTRGMAFIDIAYLTSDNIRNGYLIYKRHKTGHELRVRWEYCMQQLVSKYQSQCKAFLFPIIVEKENSRRQYLNCLHRINHHLKVLSSMLDIKPAITMYVARHSWASIAKNNNIPITVISEGLGHSSIQTTQIYLASLNDSIIDGANKKIIKKVKPSS